MVKAHNMSRWIRCQFRKSVGDRIYQLHANHINENNNNRPGVVCLGCSEVQISSHASTKTTVFFSNCKTLISDRLLALRRKEECPAAGSTKWLLLPGKALKITPNSTEKSDYAFNFWLAFCNSSSLK